MTAKDAGTERSQVDGRAPSRPSAYAWYALAIMTMVYTMSFIDRQILSILAQKIKVDLVIDDAQLGFLYGTAFAIFYTIFGIPLGRLADRWHRARLMALGLGAWSVMTLLSGFSRTYWQLALARVGVGIGEASASPAAFSMLAGYFPKARRGLAMAIYSSGVFLGMGLSLPLGGAISTAWDQRYTAASAPLHLVGWQAAFLAVGAPGMLLALWVWRLREPVRDVDYRGETGASRASPWREFLGDLGATIPPFTFWHLARLPGALKINVLLLGIISIGAVALIALTHDSVQWIAYAIGIYAIASWAQSLRASDRPTFELIWKTPGVITAVFGFGGLAIMTYSFGFWVAPYAIRTFGLNAAYVGTHIGLPGTVASAAGVILGGRLSDYWKLRNPRGRLYVGMLTAVLPLPFLCIMFSTGTFALFATLSPFVYLTANMWAGTAIMSFQDFVLPRMYGTIGAIYLLSSTIIGLALGPYFSGKIATVTGSLRAGVFSLLVVPPLTLIFLWRTARVAEQVEATKVARASAAGEVVS